MSNTIDNRYYFRMTPERYQGLPCPAEFLHKRPLVKSEAVEAVEPVEATEDSPAIEGVEGSDIVYYTIEDNLTIQQAVEIYYSQTGSGKVTPVYYSEAGDAPERVATIEECDRVVFSLWNLYGSELRAFIGAIDLLGEDPDEVIIPSGKSWNNYLKNKTLPI